ncbi:MAG: GH92 family glycosyl hydrolase [Clostridia bacterium]|nr:GH92 family glycosyl hydrolase [Clostridia bacterium]
MLFEYVDPMIGTVGDVQTESVHGGGKTHPCACVPFGMVQLGPDTVTGGDNGTGYNYEHSTIEGFSFNHLSGIGWYGDLGNIQIMPILDKTDLRSGSNSEVSFEKGTVGWRSPFSHENEIAQAGYYSVLLDRYNIQAEATVTEHAGILRFTYNKSQKRGAIINLSRRIAGRGSCQKIKIDERHIYGELVFKSEDGGFGRGRGGITYILYFNMEISTPFDYEIYENEESKGKASNYEGNDVHLVISFDSDEVLIKCGISYATESGAKDALDEIVSFDFDGTKRKAQSLWERELSRVKVTGSNKTDLILFYTCMYHTLLDPRSFCDINGDYSASFGIVANAEYKKRTVFSGWDVYRSQFPWLSLVRPDVVRDTVYSLIDIANERGTALPRWELMGADSGCMVGDPGLLILADACKKGLCQDYMLHKGYKYCLSASLCKDELDGKQFLPNRPKGPVFKEKGYEPECISSTLEFLLADFCMSQLAVATGNHADYDYFYNRAMNYEQNYNKSIGFMCPRNENGEFLDITDRLDTSGCVESNIFQQSFFVPYDIEGLAKLFGKERFISLLEELFEKADFSRLWNEYYNHSNEPCHNLTHYFSVLGLDDRTQYWTRRVQKEAYRLGAYGFCGNEDVGQLSAWYTLSAIGFAQICPAKDQFYFNTPLFKEIEVRLSADFHSCERSRCLKIICDKDPLEYPYIESAMLNGSRLNRSYITYKELTNGGVIAFNLSKTPKRK